MNMSTLIFILEKTRTGGSEIINPSFIFTERKILVFASHRDYKHIFILIQSGKLSCFMFSVLIVLIFPLLSIYCLLSQPIVFYVLLLLFLFLFLQIFTATYIFFT